METLGTATLGMMAREDSVMTSIVRVLLLLGSVEDRRPIGPEA